MFQINSLVRVIPYNYVGLFKTYNYIDNWNDANAQEDECIMLGGKYKILSVEREDNGSIFYSLLHKNINNKGWAFEKNLMLDKDVSNCPFNVGDNVVLSLSDEEIQQQRFPIWNKAYAFEDKKMIYKITEVLNNFYIFLNYEKDDPNSAPFRWDNFKKV